MTMMLEPQLLRVGAMVLLNFGTRQTVQFLQHSTGEAAIL